MSPLASMALHAGLPVIEKILFGRLGDAGGQLAGQIIRKVAESAGATPETLDDMAASSPGRVIDAMREVEKATPELVALYAADAQLQLAALQAEQGDPTWMRAWRPGWMYLLGFLWLWNRVILHVANAAWKIALPPLDTANLLALTGLFLSLYMGGHTVLRALGKTGDK